VQSQSADKHLLRSNEQKATPSGAAINILPLLKAPLNVLTKCGVELTFICHVHNKLISA